MDTALEAVGQALIFAALLFAVYYVPGQLAWRLMPDSDAPEESLPFSMGLGLLMVHVSAVLAVGMVGLFLPVYMSAWVVVGVSACWSVSLAAVHRRRTGRLLPRWPLRPTTDQRIVALLTAVSLAFFTVWFSQQVQDEDACIVRAAASINVDYLSEARQAEGAGSVPLTQGVHTASDRNAFLENYFAQRLGPGVLVSPFLALFGAFGLRLVFALHGLLMPGLGFVLGRALIGGRRGGLFAALLLTFSPYALEIQYLDENLMSGSFGTLALALLLRRRPSAFGVGMALSLFLGIRHIGVLVVPVLLAYLWRTSPRPRKDALAFGVGLTLFSLPYLVYHANMYTMFGWIYEAEYSRPPAPHSFLGLVDFKLGVLLNFPFVSEPLRSPHTAFPTLVSFPLDIIRRFGLILVALVPAGLVALFARVGPGARADDDPTGRARSARAWLLVLWFVPTVAMLMIQSNWIEPAKMGIPASVLAPLVLVMGCGAAWLLDARVGRTRRAALAALGVALPLAFVPAMARTHAPADPRVHATLPGVIHAVFPADAQFQVDESPQTLQWERDFYTSLHLLPATGYGRWHPLALAQDVGEAIEGLARPDIAHYTIGTRSLLRATTWGWLQFVGPMSRYRDIERRRLGLDPGAPRVRIVPPPPPEARATFWLDLSGAPLTAERPLIPAEPGTAPALSLLGERIYVVLNLRVPWTRGRMQLVAHRQASGRVVIAVVPQMLSEIDLWLGGLDIQVLDQDQIGGLRIAVELPVDNLLLLAESRTLIPPRTLARPVVVRRGGVQMDVPRIAY